MKIPLSIVLVVVMVGIALTTPLVGQERPQTRDGPFIGFGGGWASGGCSDSECRGERVLGPSGYLKFGGVANDWLLLGLEANWWWKWPRSAGTSIEAQVNFSAAAYFYPKTETGFFLKGGIGRSVLLDTDADTDSGLGVILGLGYEYRVRTNFSLGLYANFLVSSFDGSADGTFGGESTNVMQVGLGLTWH